MVPHPVPPRVVARMPETSLARSMREVATAPAVALRKPERFPIEREPTKASVEEAYEVERAVVEALVRVTRSSVALYVKPASPPKEPALLNCTSVVDPPGVPDPPPTHVPLTAKQPPERLKPTFEVEVAEPFTVRPESVVVPKPEAEVERAVEEALVATSRRVVSPEAPQTVRRA